MIDLKSLSDDALLELADRVNREVALRFGRARQDLKSITNAVAEGGWCSGEGTSDPDFTGPKPSDAVDTIREFFSFREEVWNAQDAKRAAEEEQEPAADVDGHGHKADL
jgi:hypothetical protein